MSAKENESVPLSHYLDFEEICKDHKKFNEDYSVFDNFTDKFKDDFFDDNLQMISKYIFLIQVVRNEPFRDMNITYTLFGIASEFLLKICALKINWDEYLEMYKSDPNKQTFKFAKKYVLNDLKYKLTPEQYKRSLEILNFIQLQRNHFAHNPFKGMDHYAVERQIYYLMAVLVDIYKLKLPKEVVAIINHNINELEVQCGMDFKDVGFDEYVARLEDYADDIPTDEEVVDTYENCLDENLVICPKCKSKVKKLYKELCLRCFYEEVTIEKNPLHKKVNIMKMKATQSEIDELQPGSTVIQITNDALTDESHYGIGSINRTSEGSDRYIGLYRVKEHFNSSGYNETTKAYIIPYSQSTMEKLALIVSINKHLSYPHSYSVSTLEEIEKILENSIQVQEASQSESP
ncbi:hypothetical protein [uncultured Methanolobus sp.]|uniref:hypothetical protein n=1 Tax=uncultured Methanolobus sp. TaxID=218300 RepID=UPI0029C8B623|nr:hypothetical protein [uncultured Methanolobus sp.]